MSEVVTVARRELRGCASAQLRGKFAIGGTLSLRRATAGDELRCNLGSQSWVTPSSHLFKGRKPKWPKWIPTAFGCAWATMKN
jgi:hypothetical protein